jgi:hypothetical protein
VSAANQSFGSISSNQNVRTSVCIFDSLPVELPGLRSKSGGMRGLYAAGRLQLDVGRCRRGSLDLFHELRHNVVRNVSEDSFPCACSTVERSTAVAQYGSPQG